MSSKLKWVEHVLPKCFARSPLEICPRFYKFARALSVLFLLVFLLCNSAPRSAWSFDLNLREQDAGYDVLQRHSSPYGMKQVQTLEKHIESEGLSGISGSSSDVTADRAAQALIQRKKQRAMTQAMSPGKQIMMVSALQNVNVPKFFFLFAYFTMHEL